MLKSLFSLVKIEHTLFALPLALTGSVLGTRGLPPILTLLLITVAFTGARATAMAFNRIADRHLDAQNPRTANREIPPGHYLSPAYGGWSPYPSRCFRPPHGSSILFAASCPHLPLWCFWTTLTPSGSPTSAIIFSAWPWAWRLLQAGSWQPVPSLWHLWYRGWASFSGLPVSTFCMPARTLSLTERWGFIPFPLT